MSRSHKKIPITWMCSSSAAMKEWKNQNDRSLRGKMNEEIPSGSYYRKLKDIWCSPSDGKIRFNEKYEDKKWKIYGK